VSRDRAVDVPAAGRGFAVAPPKPKPVPRVKQREAHRTQAGVRRRTRARAASLFSPESYIRSTSRGYCRRNGINGSVNVTTWGSLGAIQGEVARWRPLLHVYRPGTGFFWRTGGWQYFRRSFVNEAVYVAGGALASEMNSWMSAYHTEGVQPAIQVHYYERGTSTWTYVPADPGIDFTIGLTGNWCVF
jgi:hypothetical protein